MYRLLVLYLLLLVQPAGAQSQSESPGDVSELKRLIEELRQNQQDQSRRYEQRIRSLESLVLEIQSDRQQQREEDELDELLRLAESSGPPPAARPSANASLLNPQISVIPDLVVRGHGIDVDGDRAAVAHAFPELFEESDPFTLRAAEIDIRAPVAPGADAVATLIVEGAEAIFEEAFITFHDLPWGLNAKIGQFFFDFGAMNRIHQHDLPQIDRPIVYQLLFGPDAAESPGISVSKILFTTDGGGLLPAYSELTIEGINGSIDRAPVFGDERINKAAVLARWKNFWQITQVQDLEAGISVLATGNNRSGESRSSTVVGGDVTWRVRGSDPAAFDSWIIQGELIGSSVETDPNTVNALGGYLTVQKQFDPNWYGGLRLDAAQSPTVEDANIYGLAPYVTHYLNEFIRLRLQYNYLTGKVDGSSAVNQGLAAQLTWVFGAHPPEPYWVNR